MRRIDFVFRTAAALTAIVALTATTATGQSTVVWPVGYANQRGNVTMAPPFTVTRDAANPTTRVMHSLTAASLPFGSGRQIRGISWRRDALANTSYAAVQGEIRIRIGQVPNAMRLAGTFANPWTDLVEVVPRRAYSVPAAARPSGGGPAAFLPTITFDRPFDYRGGDLVIEIEFHGPPGALWRRDAVQTEVATSAVQRTVGRGCASSNGMTPDLWTNLRLARPGGAIRAKIDLAPWPDPAAAFGVLFVGGGMPAFPLAWIGMPIGCHAHVYPLETMTSPLADRSAQFTSASFWMPVPNDRSFSGASVVMQGLVADSQSTAPLPMAASDAIALTLGSTPPATTPLGRSVWWYGASGAGGGQVSPDNTVPVLRFSL